MRLFLMGAEVGGSPGPSHRQSYSDEDDEGGAGGGGGGGGGKDSITTMW